MDFTTNNTQNLQQQNQVYKPYNNGFERASLVMGIVSIITGVMFLGTIPMVLGALAIILALLSRGRGEIQSKALGGLICGFIGLTMSLVVVAFTVFIFLTSPTQRQRVNDMSKQLYGYTLNDVIESYVGDDFDLEEFLTK